MDSKKSTDESTPVSADLVLHTPHFSVVRRQNTDESTPESAEVVLRTPHFSVVRRENADEVSLESIEEFLRKINRPLLRRRNTNESGFDSADEEMEIVSIAMMELVSGGTDYSYAYSVMNHMLSDYQNLLSDGLSETKARSNIREKYWQQLLTICEQHPEDGVSAEKQANIILMFTIGS